LTPVPFHLLQGLLYPAHLAEKVINLLWWGHRKHLPILHLFIKGVSYFISLKIITSNLVRTLLYRAHSTHLRPNFFPTPATDYFQPDSLLLCDSIHDLANTTQAIESPCSEDELGSSGSEMSAFMLKDQPEENYTSSLFQTEPLYQFYNENFHEVNISWDSKPI